MDLKASLLRNKSQNFVVNIFEVTTFSTKHIFRRNVVHRSEHMAIKDCTCTSNNMMPL